MATGNQTGYIKHMDDGEVRLLLSWFRNHVNACVRRLYYCILILTLGLRVGEVVRLRKENFSENCDRLVYTLEKTNKIHERLIPEWMAAELREYRATIPTFTDWFFWKSQRYLSGQIRAARKHICSGTVQAYFFKARRELGLDDVYYTIHYANRPDQKMYRITPHTLRHWAAEKWYEISGHDIRATASIIGHTSCETTLRHYVSPRRFVETAFLERAYTNLHQEMISPVKQMRLNASYE